MKKLLLIAVMLFLIFPLNAFNVSKKMPEGIVVKMNKKPRKVPSKKHPTGWDMGSIYSNGVTYEIYGDNFGGSSGNIIDIQVGGVSIPYAYTGYWDHNGGIPHTLLWAYVTFTQPPSDFNGAPAM